MIVSQSDRCLEEDRFLLEFINSSAFGSSLLKQVGQHNVFKNGAKPIIVLLRANKGKANKGEGGRSAILDVMSL